MEQQDDGKAYAVIYGASTHAGHTFAHYLADKGFNLILIERDLQPLNDLENSIKERITTQSNSGSKSAQNRGQLTKMLPQIIKIVL